MYSHIIQTKEHEQLVISRITQILTLERLESVHDRVPMGQRDVPLYSRQLNQLSQIF